MNAYHLMRMWDAEAGRTLRSPSEHDQQVPAALGSDCDYEEWKTRLEAHDIAAMLEGRTAWGLPPMGAAGSDEDCQEA